MKIFLMLFLFFEPEMEIRGRSRYVFETIPEKIPYIPPPNRLVGFENKDL